MTVWIGGILSNTCRVTVWIEWNIILGSLQAELDLGPKTKFVVLMLLYIFHLRDMTIRVVD